MSWLSKATGIHWGNIGAPIGAVIGSVVPGIGTAIGGALGNAIGGLSGHKNNTAGNLVDFASEFGGAIPGVGGILNSGMQKIGNVISDIPGAKTAEDWLGTQAGKLGGNVMPKAAGTIAGGPTATANGVTSAATMPAAPGTSTINPDEAVSQELAKLGQVPAPASPPVANTGNGVLGSIGQLFTDPKTGKFDIAKALQMGLTVGQALEAASASRKAGQLANQSEAAINQGMNTIYHPAPLTGMGAGVNNPTNAVAAQAAALQQILQAQKAAAAQRP